MVEQFLVDHLEKSFGCMGGKISGNLKTAESITIMWIPKQIFAIDMFRTPSYILYKLIFDFD